jgi:acetyl-CoA synthetase (ADP-forming)
MKSRKRGGSMDLITKALEEGKSLLSEHKSKLLLQSYGIPVTREKEVSNKEALLEATLDIGFPLVMKGCGSDLSHKTERNLVHLDIRSRDEALGAFDVIYGEVEKEGGTVLVQEMVKGTRELVMGLIRDRQFGPCVMFGLGGIFTEILKDISFRVAPLERLEAREMMMEIKARKILEALRGLPSANMDELADVLITLGTIGLEQEAVKEIDINPVILNGGHPVAVDALVVLDQKET